MNVFTDNILLISLASSLCSTHKRPQQIILKAKKPEFYKANADCQA